MKRVLSAVLMAAGVLQAQERSMRGLPPEPPPVLVVPAVQSPQAAKAGEAPYRIRSYTKLVQVAAIVTDGSGRHVRGMKKEDFLIREGKNLRPVAVFDEISTETTAEENRAVAELRRSLPPGEFANVVAGRPLRPRAITIVVVDLFRMRFTDQARGREQLLKYLKQKVEPDSLISLLAFTSRGLVSLHEYSADPKILIEALNKAKPGAHGLPSDADVLARAEGERPVVYSADDYARVQREVGQLNDFLNGQDQFSWLQRQVRDDVTLNSLRGIAAAYGGIPGRKSLIWLASEFPSYWNPNRMVSSSDPNNPFLRIFEALNDANIAVYPVDVNGLDPAFGFSAPRMASLRNPLGNVVGMRPDPSIAVGNDGRGTAFDQLQTLSMPNVQENVREIAEVTGGLPFYNSNDLVKAMARADEDSSHYYLLGYYLPSGESARPGRRTLKVEVRRPGLKVRSRTRLFVAASSQQGGDDVNVAARSPLEFTTLPVRVRFDATRATSDGPAPFEVVVSGSEVALEGPRNQMALDVVAVTRNEHGELWDRVGRTLEGKITAEGKFREKMLSVADKIKLPPSGGTARFIVRDQVSGRIGSVIVELQTSRQSSAVSR